MAPLVYLAGPIRGCTWDAAVDWRQYAVKYLAKHGIFGISPMRGKEYLQDYVTDQTGGIIGLTYPDTHPMSSPHGITKRDRWDVSRCDLVLMNLENSPPGVPSFGTIMELAWADAFGRYVLLAMEAGNMHAHPMVTETANLVVPTFEEALRLTPIILGT